MNALTTTVNGQAELDRLRQRMPGYTPEWSPNAPASAAALMSIFARYIQLLQAGLEQVPSRSQLAFLDMLGVQLLPAQAARAPLVFSLIEGCPVDVTLAANSQVAARPTPAIPSPSATNQPQPADPQPILFATAQTITLSRGRLITLYSMRPGSDEYADHSDHINGAFALFDDMTLTEHTVYLGHDTLFALAGDVKVLVSFSLDAPAGQRQKMQWEYLAAGGWLPFESLEQDDTTQGLTTDGQIVLRRPYGPNSKQDDIGGHTSYWLRGRLATPLLPDGTGHQRSVPVINDVRVRVSIDKDGLLPESAFADGVPLDLSKPFYPFGQQPAAYATFYLASKEVFQRKGARVRMDLKFLPPGIAHGALALEWEYFDGTGWTHLPIEQSGYQFTAAGTLTFTCPSGWAETAVNGVKNYWLRVRITAGNFGSPTQMATAATRKVRAISQVLDKTITVNSSKGYSAGEVVVLSNATMEMSATVASIPSDTTMEMTDKVSEGFVGGSMATPAFVPATLQPPVISGLALGYSYLTDPAVLDHCLAHNDFVLQDYTQACRWPDQSFQPFQPLADRQPAVYFGFDQPLPVGLISLYVDVPQTQSGESSAESASPFVWECWTARGWAELGVLDETLGFRRNGMIQFIGPPDALPSNGLGDSRYRIRARVKQGEQVSPLPISGVWLNAVWASQSALTERETLGVSDGNPGQTFFMRRTPVLESEMVEVLEWTGRGEYWQTAVQNVPEADLRFERDAATDVITAVWVRWHAQPHLYGSGPNSRHYVIERARGLTRFGDGRNGLIPPAGSRIDASYRYGGGLAGNVPAGAISELRTAVPFIMSATNPVLASGGATTEPLESVRERGPQHLRHGDRAVAATDIEWLAREASPDVAHARCLPVTGPAGQAQRGWVTVVVVSHGAEAQPAISPELRRRVREHLAQRVPAAVAKRVRIVGPQYVPVGVRAAIVPKRPDQAAQVEARVRAALNDFLHPVTGGPDGQGWVFGQGVHLSQIAGVIKQDIGVDYTYSISLCVTDRVFGEFVPVEANGLIAAGDHELRLSMGGN